ncbi:zinc metalloproteinase nas-14-like [Nematolebias whitei]|uniref:zinc metalloproteinase nas-14-like n=1 Tax=Nematolebias whitei TaxID=451745 RepID=UPI00189992FC|nr:zinc metalloproteinase nas-14-like [Nematolebias whitei]
MLLCFMWLLGFCSSSTGVPVSSTNGAASASGNASTLSIVDLFPAANQTSEVGALTSESEVSNVSSETLEELQLDLPLDEGDIILTEDRNAVSRVWKNAVVPYIISPEMAHRTADIEKAFKMITSSTCVRFKDRTDEANYLYIRTSKGCASYIGCLGGSQSVYFADACSVGNICHELVHALGLHHEHNRQDRDLYISVKWTHIAPDQKKNFEIKRGDLLDLPYDLGSIMHYGTSYFSIDGSPTIVSKDSRRRIGQRSHLSKLDIKKLNALYHCSK